LREATTEDADFSECLIIITFSVFLFLHLEYIVR